MALCGEMLRGMACIKSKPSMILVSEIVLDPITKLEAQECSPAAWTGPRLLSTVFCTPVLFVENVTFGI